MTYWSKPLTRYYDASSQVSNQQTRLGLHKNQQFKLNILSKYKLIEIRRTEIPLKQKIVAIHRTRPINLRSINHNNHNYTSSMSYHRDSLAKPMKTSTEIRAAPYWRCQRNRLQGFPRRPRVDNEPKSILIITRYFQAAHIDFSAAWSISNLDLFLRRVNRTAEGKLLAISVRILTLELRKLRFLAETTFPAIFPAVRCGKHRSAY